MADSAPRRPVDWDLILPGWSEPATAAAPRREPSRLAALTAEVMTSPSQATLDRLLRHAVEFARVVLELERTAIYLLDVKHHIMVGTFGTDADGETVDEHGLMYEFGPLDREVFSRAEAGFPWTAYDDCPHIAQRDGKTHVIGRGWLACTAIAGPRGPIGILYNDSARTHAPLDEAKQSRAAILCSLIGRALEPCRSFLVPASSSAVAPHQGVVQGVTELLVRDPSLTCDAIAKDLKLTPRRLTKTFKRETNTSIVKYRNELRLARFFARVDSEANRLLEAALEAGFGSYAQFHRVFRARYGQSPRDYVLDRQKRRS